MLRLLGLMAVVLMLAAAPASAQQAPPQVTQWRVHSSEGLDALLLLGAAAGDTMQASIYPDEIAWVRSHISPAGLAALSAIDARCAGPAN